MLQSVVIRWERPETVFEATAIIGNNCEFPSDMAGGHVCSVFVPQCHSGGRRLAGRA